LSFAIGVPFRMTIRTEFWFFSQCFSPQHAFLLSTRLQRRAAEVLAE
jgi:hypothetical protein